MLSIGCCIVMPEKSVAQTEQKVKVKKTSTVGQKVANSFRKKPRKKYKGVKVKQKIERPSTGATSR